MDKRIIKYLTLQINSILIMKRVEINTCPLPEVYLSSRIRVLPEKD